MKTIVVRIEGLRGTAADRGYPLKLFVDDGDEGWREQPKASSLIPEALDNPGLPVDENGRSLSRNDVIRFLLAEADTSTAFLAIGRWLHGLIARDGVGEVMARCREEHWATGAGGQGVRLVLDIEPDDLRRLPWELMAREDDRLFLNSLNPCLRGPTRFAVAPEPDLLPVRLLIVVGCMRTDVKAEEELASIVEALRGFKGRVEWDILRGPGKDEFLKLYSAWRPHILHFIGHGSQVAGVGPVLEFCDGDGNRWDLSRGEVTNLLNQWAGRLVVLNACRTAAPDPETASADDAGPTDEDRAKVHEVSWTLAEAFRQLGYPAVVAMQADIDASAAAAFAGPFYAALADGVPVDAALADARMKIYAGSTIYAGSGLDRREWALPSLHLSIPPEQLLSMRPGLSRQEFQLLGRIPEFAEISPFVDRSTERRTLWLGLDPEGFPMTPSPELMAVVGPPDLGKTWLIRYCLRTCRIRGREVRYVDLRRGESIDFLEVLRAIRDGATANAIRSPLQEPLPREFFYSFNHDLNHMVLGREPSPYQPEMGAVEDAKEQLRPDSLVEQIFESFASSLTQAARGRPLVIALDDVGSVERSSFRDLCRFLFARIAGGLDMSPVRMVVGLTRDEFEDRWPPQLKQICQRVRVGNIPANEFFPLAREFFVHNGEDPKRHEEWIRTNQEFVKSAFPPSTLKTLLHLARQINGT